MSRPAAYRPEIDGLRCIAVLAVIFYHAGLPGFRGGFVGVDIFFVISGFLITGIVHGELRRGTFSLRGFYERRVRRIFPALALMLAVTATLAWFVLTPGQYKAFGQSLAACVAFLSNIYFYLRTDYFAPQAEELPLLHTWSLAVEEQFYLVFPALLWAAMRWFPRRVLALVGIAAGASLALCLHRQAEGSDALNFFDATSRAWQLAAGSLLAIAIADRGPGATGLPRAARESFALAGLALVLAPIFMFDPRGAQVGWQLLFPVVGAVLLLWLATPDTFTGRVLSSRPMVAIGLVSYSAYLWHQPLFALTVVRGGGHPAWPVVLGLIALTMFLAWLSWKFVEGPFRDRKAVSTRTVWSAFFAVSGLLAAAGIVLHLSGGVPSRFDARQNAEMASGAPSPYRETCHAEGLDYLKPSRGCRLLDAKTVHWAVLGDSHGVELSYALALELRARGEGGVLQLTSSGCQPALGFESGVPGCSAWLREALDVLAADRDITHVALVWRHSFYLFGDHRPFYPALPDDAPNFLAGVPPTEARARYVASLDALVGRLQAAGKRVLLVDPVPELPKPAEYYVFSPALRDRPLERGLAAPLSHYQGRNAYILEALGHIAAARGAARVPTAALFCPDARCRVLEGGTLLYFDDNHLSAAGARRLARRVADLGAGDREGVR